MTNSPRMIICHHTASPRDTTTALAVNNFHRDKDWDVGPGVARAPISSLGWHGQYHYFIEASGRLVQYAQESELRWHAGPDVNTRSIAICMAGWYDDGHDDMPTEAQVKTLKRLIQDIQRRYRFTKEQIHGHRDFMQKTCPGNHISIEWLRSLAVDGGVVPTVPPDPAFAKKFNGMIIVAAEDHGRKWFVYKGTRIEIDKAPEFERRLSGKPFVVWMNNADLARIPLM